MSSSGTWLRVVWEKGTDVSVQPTAVSSGYNMHAEGLSETSTDS